MKSRIWLLILIICGSAKAQTLIWSENFDSGANWISAGPSGHNPPNFGWSVGNQTNSWYTEFQPTMGTSGSFARFRNGSTTNAIQSGPFTYTYASTIDLSQYSHAVLEFDQYGARFFTSHAVQISLDGLQWTTVHTNDDITPLTVNYGSPFPLAMNRVVNLSPYLVGNTQNVKIRFLWDGGINGVISNYFDYGWYIDNIKIFEGPENWLNLGATTYAIGNLGIPYTKFPTAQYGDSISIYFKGKISNFGENAQNTSLTIQLPNTTLNTEEQILSSNDFFEYSSDTLDLTTLLPNMTLNDIYYAAESSTLLSYPNNAVASQSLEITEKIMAQDDYNGSTSDINGAFSGWANSSGNSSIGLVYEIFEDCNLSFVQTKLANVSTLSQDNYIGAPIQAEFWKWDPLLSEYMFVQITDEHLITASDFGDQLITLQFDNAVPFLAGDQIAVLVSLNAVNPVPIAMSGYTKAGNTIGFNGANLMTYQAVGDSVLAPVVRIDFTDYTFAIESEVVSASCASNCDGTVSISLTGPGSNQGPFAYSWFYEGNPIANIPPDFSQNMCAGAYDVQISNAFYTTSHNFVIDAPYGLEYDLEILPSDCQNNQAASIEVIPNGNISDFNIIWMNGETNFLLTNASISGPNSFILSDNLGCSLTSEDIFPEIIEPDFGVDFSGTTSIDLAITPSPTLSFQNLTPNITDFSFTWDIWGTPIENNDEFVEFPGAPILPGVYDVTLSASNSSGCTQTEAKSAFLTVTNSVGTQSLVHKNILVFPNPSTGVFELDFGYQEYFAIAIYDNLGQLVKNINIDSDRSEIDLTNFESGVYNARITRKDGGAVFSVKLIKL